MNRQEAIEIITGLYRVPVENGADEFASEINKAIDMAIEALEAQQELVDATNEIYAKGYNAAKREIALSGEYERAYHRGKVDATKWIPVSERLPEVGSEVLVCFDFKCNRSVYISNFYGDGEFRGFDDEYLTPEGRKYRKAVAWRPLPAPYKESDDK